MDAKTVARIRRKYTALAPEMNERSRRQWAACEARDLGYGGVSLVSKATGISRPTICVGLQELDLPTRQRESEASRVRRTAGGRHRITYHDPDLIAALESLVEPLTRGDPESPLRWTCKSTRKLAEELTRISHPVSSSTVRDLLHQSGYSLQANCKTREGRSHPDRNAQFEFIDRSVSQFLRRGQPAISVDTKKKELVGDFKNGGEEWHPQGSPEEVRTHDFLDKNPGKAIPYGVYDILNNQGWVNVGIDHDTARFAANSILQWWTQMGAERFPATTELLVTA
ncbi:MAG: ISAzo13 family transposase, partial [Planctomycetaceae bacterium]|nr:ISAzo13 family transposase [Planctomycetaceae bacterium]